MSASQWQRVRIEWGRNRRLRVGALAILGILGLQLVLVISDARARQAEQYRRDASLLSRLEEASRESAWPERARSAAAELAKAQASIPVASTEGLAQAELQAWLGDLAVFAGIGNPAVKVEPALAVDGQPGLWQVIARMDGEMSENQAPLLMHTLSAALPWFRTERLQVQSGTTTRMSLVIRGYFRKGDGKQADALRPAALPSAATSLAAGAPPAPVPGNPLARMAPAGALPALAAKSTEGRRGPPSRAANGARAGDGEAPRHTAPRKEPATRMDQGASQGATDASPQTSRPRNPLAPPDAATRPKPSSAEKWDRPRRPRRPRSGGE